MKTVVEQIKDRLPITEVLSSYLQTEQSGNQLKAKCPFHNERTASFYISPDRGLYYCFGCGAKGDIFSFVEQFEGLDFKGTLKLLADRAGIVLSRDSAVYSDTDPIYEALEKACAIYQKGLEHSPKAKEYLSERGLTKETIDSFRIGYVGDEWRTIESVCTSESDRDGALRAGLIKKTEGKVYDRFRKRIMFPLSDGSGRVIGFSGRSFPQDDKSPKYLNSPETEVFQKSKTLFGFDKAKFHIKKHNFAILVEGQFDLVLSHQAGFRNTVASSGTAVSEESARDPFSNLSVLARLTPHLFLAFDGDQAGQNAMDRAALVALSLGMNPKVVSLPEGVDPADFIKTEGVDAWKEKLKESKHFIEHHLVRIKQTAQSPHLFVRTIKEKLFPFLARVASAMEKNLYIKKISEETGMPTDAIIEELSKVASPLPEALEKKEISRQDEISSYERLTALRKCFPSEKIEQAIEELNALTVGDLAFSAPAIPEDRFERVLTLVERDYGRVSEEDRVRIAHELAKSAGERFLKDAHIRYTNELKQAELNGTDEEITSLLKTLEEIHKRRHERGGA